MKYHYKEIFGKRINEISQNKGKERENSYKN